MSKHIYQHIASEQKKFAKQIINHLSRLQVADYYIDLGFLDPSEQNLVINLANNREVAYYIEKFYEQQERCRVFLGNTSYLPSSIILAASYNNKFNHLEHRHVLGTLINEVADFKEYGDIIIHDDHFQIICSEQAFEELQISFPIINKAKIKYEIINEITYVKPVAKQKTYVVSSLRLDNVVKVIMGVARSAAQKQIRNKLVNVNYIENSNVNHELKLGDLISVRKYGRKKIVAIEATRTDKYRIVME